MYQDSPEMIARRPVLPRSTWLKRSITPLLVCLNVVCISSVGSVLAQNNDEPNREKSGSNQRHENAMKIQWRQAISTLRNKNVEPTIVGDEPDQEALFGKSYDWKEQERVLAAIQKLVNNSDDAWQELLETVDDKHYCITFQRAQSVANYSVGDVCRAILLCDLTAAYIPHLPSDVEVYRKLAVSKIIPRDDRSFKEWCSKKKLYELQIDLCEDAVKELSEINNLSSKEKHTSIDQIKKQVTELRAARKPVLVKSIVEQDVRMPYAEEDARAIRAKLNKKAGPPLRLYEDAEEH
ncbi:MAG: hypothetical protein K8T91_28055 [Planctomycetes bacterium]|nr:hypothetical protein [Planctomycetota bacterium]